MGKRDDKRLKKVINLEFIIFSLVAIAVTMVLSTFIFYEVYKAEIIRDLKGYAEVFKNTGDFDADDWCGCCSKLGYLPPYELFCSIELFQ